MFSKQKLPLWLIKIFNYEYWTWWVFFLPLAPYWMYLAFRNRSLTYFTTVNPCIPDGGVFGESKKDILDLIDKSYRPADIFVFKGESWEHVKLKLTLAQINFPVVAKPDVGGRGFKVYKLETPEALKIYLEASSQPVIVQEFIDYDIELGVMYARMPHASSGQITSIVHKEFLHITGDEKSTVEQLLSQNLRARFSMDELRERVKEQWHTVPKKGETMFLQPIGNHCLGTKFLNGNHLINEQLVKVFDKIAIPIDGFYYGRFDLKVPTWEDLYEGRNIKILELNGATSEPGHVYDPNYTLWKAYRDIMYNMKTVADISAYNMRRGIRPTPLRELIQTSRTFFAMSGQL